MISDGGTKTDGTNWNKGKCVSFSLPIACVRIINVHVSTVLVCLLSGAYTLLGAIMNIDVHALGAKFECSCLQTREIFKNTWEES